MQCWWPLASGQVSFHSHFGASAAAAPKSLQSCLTLWDPIDSSPPGSPIPGILQARVLGWVAISFSSSWKWNVKVKSHSRVRLLETPWTAAHQAPLLKGFSRQENWSRLPLPSLCTACIMLLLLKRALQQLFLFNFLFYIWVQPINNDVIDLMENRGTQPYIYI